MIEQSANRTPERLAIGLKLTIAGKDFSVAPGDVKRLELDLFSWGHEGLVEFIVADTKTVGGKDKDELLATFLKPGLVEIEISIKAALSDDKAKDQPTAVKVKGIVLSKTLVEIPSDKRWGKNILFRRYGVRFCDAARHLWRQNNPCVLYTNKTLKDVINAHKGDKVTLEFKWDELTKSSPQWFLPLVPEHGASFYDFVLWYVHQNNGVFTYDYKKQGYKFASEKDASGKPQLLIERYLDRIEVVFPEVIRHKTVVLNSYTEATKHEECAQKQAAEAIRHDVLLTTPIGDEVTARVSLEKKRLTATTRGLELDVKYTRLPPAGITPGALVDLKPATGLAAAGIPSATEVFRVRSVRLAASAIRNEPHHDHLADHTEYDLHLATRLELKADPFVDLPPFRTPHWPLFVEGKIVSEQGKDDEDTWHAYKDSKTSLDYYKIKIPLWSNQIITTPFNPNLLPGQFYFPAYKKERVLVALSLKKAQLKRFLDWRTGARLPVDGQGVHLLVGKTTKSGVSTRHYYEEQKPIFSIKRTNDKDMAHVQMKEGNLLILVKENK